MPELPEVECVRRTLEPAVLGRRVAQVRTTLPKLARPNPRALARGMGHRVIQALGRHGKLLIMHLDDGSFWTIHLGMTGQVILASQRPQAKHIHITVSFDDGGPRLYFRDPRQFGAMTHCPDQAALQAGPLANMGPDALGLGQEEFIERLAKRGGRLKSVLLDQRVLAGVGNIYADESLHMAGLHPLSRPSQLSAEDLGRLHQALQEVLRLSLKRGGSSVSNFVDARGRPGTFQHAHRVYRRTGQPCPVCAGIIQRTVVAGRSTHYCTQCQSRERSCKS